MAYKICRRLLQTYAVVRLQVVNVLAKDEGPEVFAEKLDDIEGVVEAGAVAGESAVIRGVRETG